VSVRTVNIAVETVTFSHSKDKIENWASTFINGFTEDMIIFQQQNTCFTFRNVNDCRQASNLRFVTVRSALIVNLS